MSRARNIKPGFFENELLAEIDPLGRLLFIGLWTIADREGRLEDRVKRIKAKILPYDDCDVDKLLDELAKRGFIIRYEVEGSRYIQVTNFKKHQNPHVKEVQSTIPAPCKNHTSMLQETNKNRTNPAESLILNPESLNPITESINPIKDMSVDTESQSSKIEPALESKNEIQEIMNFYNQQFKGLWSKDLKLTKERMDHIKTRLKTFTSEDLKTAIVNLRASPFHCGENDRGQIYATPEFLFRNDSQVDKWLNMKGGKNGGTRAYQKPDRKPLTAEDYDEPEYRELVRASERRIKNLSEVPPGNQELP